MKQKSYSGNLTKSIKLMTDYCNYLYLLNQEKQVYPADCQIVKTLPLESPLCLRIVILFCFHIGLFVTDHGPVRH